jgi:hypothetical protein
MTTGLVYKKGIEQVACEKGLRVLTAMKHDDSVTDYFWHSRGVSNIQKSDY